MDATLESICSDAPDHTNLESLLAAVVRKRWAAFVLWREKRARYRALAALGDETLKDIGLHRTGLWWKIEESLADERDATPAGPHAPSAEGTKP